MASGGALGAPPALAPPRRGAMCHNRPMRFFNTEGPVLRPENHYAIDPLERGDVGEVLELIRAKRHFALHAPRQTGKTAVPIALRGLLNSGKAGNFRCISVGCDASRRC